LFKIPVMLHVLLLSLLIFTAWGCLGQLMFFKNTSHPVYTLLNGMFFYMLITWTVLYFTGSGFYFQLIFFLLSLPVAWALKKRCSWRQILLKQWQSWTVYEKIFFVFAGLLLMYLNSIPSVLPDHETYYLQTIKWANTKGFVMGLMNIHPFLGQFSGWHILQAGVNLPYNTVYANGLNGFFLLMFLYWVVLDKKYFFPFWLRLIVLLMPVWVVFIGSPSPGLPVWLISLLVFDLFLRDGEHMDEEVFKQFTFLVFFSILIKPTAAVNLILWLIVWFKQIHRLKKLRLFVVSVAGISSVLWLSKNFIITGYFFYPFDFGSGVFHPKWQYPPDLLHYLGQLGRKENLALIMDKNLPASFLHWLWDGGLVEKVLNPSMLLLLLLFPVILYKNRFKLEHFRTYRLLYVVLTVYFIFLLFISPNVRFYLHGFMFMILVAAELLMPASFRKNYSKALGSILIVSLLLLIIYTPYKPCACIHPVLSRFSVYESQTKANLKYFYPVGEALFWETGNAPLPACTPSMLEFFETNFHYYLLSAKK